MTVEQFENAFAEHEKAISITIEQIFAHQAEDGVPEDIRLERAIRSAAILEQVFGGISRRLWDDPFEWTLPEAISSKESAHTYLEEVIRLRKEAMAAIRSDEELDRLIPAPSQMCPIRDVLNDALRRSQNILSAS
jgi:hypothetical protein